METYQYMPQVPPRRVRLLPWVGQIWRDFGYLTLQFFLASFAFTYVVLTASLLPSLAITVVGPFAVGGLVLGARGWAAMYRSLDSNLLGSNISPPPAFVRPRGFWRGLGAMLFDGTGWRALLYMFITFPLAILTWLLSLTWLAVGVGALTHWAWSWALPAQTMYDGTQIRGFVIVNADSWYWAVDSTFRTVLLALVGVAFLFMWAPMTHAFAKLFALLGSGLLGPTAGSIRVMQLRQQRRAVVVDADTRLRQIERDLHDGTQARLTLVGMQLGEAEELLATGVDPEVAAELVAGARAATQEAMVELRDIARGIRPPALDAGLGVAVHTLTARTTAIPVALYVDPEVDASPLNPAVASIAYYGIAEALANASKYSGATRAEVRLRRELDPVTSTDVLRATITDNGTGGAVITEGIPGVGGTGLAAMQAKAEAVDGSLRVESPLGGGTVVELTIPAGP